jgi:hypothetical protein
LAGSDGDGNMESGEVEPARGLSDLAKDLSLTDEQVLGLAWLEKEYYLEEVKFQFKREFVKPLLWLFVGANSVIILLLVILGYAEWKAVFQGREIERLITSEVIMTMIGATTVQLGAIMFTIAKSIFNESSGND